MATPPRRIGRYEVSREIAHGEAAVVYQAFDPDLGRKVAIKTIDLSVLDAAEREAVTARFFEEAKTAARLVHPGIATVFDVGREPETGRLFLALEYVEGRTLEEMTDAARPLPWREALALLAAVARALHYLHQNGVLHRRLRPANVIVNPFGLPKLLEVGISAVDTVRLKLAATGQIVGAPIYLAPEQALGEPIDPRTDIFALGCVAYRLLTGRHAFSASTFAATVERLLHEEPMPPSHIVGGIPRSLDALVARALEKSPAARYATATQFAEDVDEILAGRPPHRGVPSAATLALFEATARIDVVAAPAPAASAGQETWLLNERTSEAGAAAAAEAPPAYQQAAATDQKDRTFLPGERAVLRRRGTLRVAVGLAILAGVAALHRLRTEEAVPPAPPDTTSLGQPAAAPPPLLPEAEQQSEPVQSGPAPSPASQAAPEVARTSLQIDLEHSLKNGVLRVYVDGVQVLERGLRAAESKKLLVFKSRRGSLRETLDVAPGERRVRVEVAVAQDRTAETIMGVFRSGSRRRLFARFKRAGEGGLSLEWR